MRQLLRFSGMKFEDHSIWTLAECENECFGFSLLIQIQHLFQADIFSHFYFHWISWKQLHCVNFRERHFDFISILKRNFSPHSRSNWKLIVKLIKNNKSKNHSLSLPLLIVKIQFPYCILLKIAFWSWSLYIDQCLPHFKCESFWRKK